MKKYTTTKPLWFRIQGDSKKSATLLGVRQRMRDLGMETSVLETVQDGDLVSHKWNGMKIDVD